MDSDVHKLLMQGQRDRAFEEILDRYETKVFRLVLSMVGNAARAQEVAQDAFLKVWQGLEGFDQTRSAIGTWGYAIARNTALTYLRGEAYRHTLALHEISAPAAAPLSRYGDDDLQSSVQQLPGELRDVVVLYYYQERSVEDVALMLDLPSGTVKSHLSRARKMLAAKLRGAKQR